MKNTSSEIAAKTMSNQSAFHYRMAALARTMVNLYFRHTKQNDQEKQVTSIRRAAFRISSSRVPRFTTQAMSYTRPSNYY